MSAVAQMTVQSPALTPHSGAKASQGWVCLDAPHLSRLVATELITNHDELGLTSEALDALQKLSAEKSAGMPLRLWVQLDGVTWHAQTMDEKERREAALRILILRKANYALIRHLFAISRDRWRELRQELGAEAPDPRKPSLLSNTSVVDAVFNKWHQLLREYDSPIDRWVVMAQSFRELPMACLYELIFEPGGQDD